MVRFLLWVFVMYLIVQFVSAVSKKRSYRPPNAPPPRPSPTQRKPFTNIQDADFEDITPSDPDSKK